MVVSYDAMVDIYFLFQHKTFNCLYRFLDLLIVIYSTSSIFQDLLIADDGSKTLAQKLCCFLLDPTLPGSGTEVCVSFFGEEPDDLPKISAEGDVIRLDRFRVIFRVSNYQSVMHLSLIYLMSSLAN